MKLNDIKKHVVNNPNEKIWAIREVYLVNGKHLRLAKERVDSWLGYVPKMNALKPVGATETTNREELLRELVEALDNQHLQVTLQRDTDWPTHSKENKACRFCALLRRAQAAMKGETK